ncbi:MAG: hypothetical protein WAQ29_03390, partial [Nitrososphaeraceae archaeon]
MDIIKNALGMPAFWYGLHEFDKEIEKDPPKEYAQLIYKIIEFRVKLMAQIPALIPKEVEIQRLKKIYIMVIMLGSIAASVEVDNFVDGSLHQTAIRDSAFTPAHW